MKRKSLKFKLSEIAKIGTLRTFSREEAVEYCSKQYLPDMDFTIEQINKTKDAYDRGLILCVFAAYPEKADSLECSYVFQLTKSLADFVINIVYVINFE